MAAHGDSYDGLHIDVRSGHRLCRYVIPSTGYEINGPAIAADVNGGWVVTQHQFPGDASSKPYDVRAASLDAAGRRIGAVQDLGEGQFGMDSRTSRQLAVRADGRAVLAIEAENGVKTAR